MVDLPMFVSIVPIVPIVPNVNIAPPPFSLLTNFFFLEHYLLRFERETLNA